MASVRTAAKLHGFEFDPLRWLWRVLTSVRFALAIIGFLATASLTGVLVPQLPVEMRGNVTAEAAWLRFQEDRFGFLTEPMLRLGLFEVFRSVWFVSGLGLLVVSVCVCTANRLPPVWRNVFEPQTRVPDEYFDRAGPVIEVEAGQPEALRSALRARRYRVSLTTEGTTTYIFADRYPWAQLATFVSHLALILFLAGGLVTLLTARDENIFIGEGETRPVFNLGDADHMQIQVEDAIGKFNQRGFPLDYRTYMVVYRNGNEVARGVATVNAPLSYGGFKFHQTAYFPDGVLLRVRDVASGRLVYDEVLALTSRASTPRVVVRDAAGNPLLDDLIVPTDFIGDAAGTLVSVPGTGRDFWFGARPADAAAGWQLVVFETARPEGARAVLDEGEKRELDGLSVSFVGMTSVPSIRAGALPGAAGEAIAELSAGPNGPLLTVGPIQGRALALSPGEAVELGGFEYAFGGRREFAGITVRRDPGSSFIWLATGLLLLGLALTFYTPRRRLWGKITAGQALFRGIGGRTIAIESEIRQLMASFHKRGTSPENG